MTPKEIFLKCGTLSNSCTKSVLATVGFLGRAVTYVFAGDEMVQSTLDWIPMIRWHFCFLFMEQIVRIFREVQHTSSRGADEERTWVTA
jgi:hypothetical protein